MDMQMKRGFLEACVLATLRRRESYGYQIVKDVPKSLGLTESTLYPLLKRLEAADCIAARTAEHNGRLRKYYRITPAGLARIGAFMAERDEVMGIYRYIEDSSAVGAMDGSEDASAEADASHAECAEEPAAIRTAQGTPATAHPSN